MTFDETGLRLKKHYLITHLYTGTEVYFTPLSKSKGCFKAIAVTITSGDNPFVTGPVTMEIGVDYCRYMYSPFEEISKADWTKLQLRASNDLQNGAREELEV